MKKRIVIMLALMLLISAFAELNEDIVFIQQKLTELGYYSGEANGSLSDETRSAIKSFQIANGLAKTGNADSDTLTAITSENAVSRRDYLVDLASSYSNAETLEKGSKGDGVLHVQKRLSELGYLNDRNDGAFGDATQGAVLRFQFANGLECSGKVDSLTRYRLFEGSVYSWNDWLTTMCTSKGASGANVRTLQKRLKKLGYYTKSPSGIYGDSTQDAVRAFQRRNALETSGNVDTRTAEALYSTQALKAEEAANAQSREDVGILQTRLWELGYYNTVFTDENDFATQSAVRLFQMANGLNVTGAADEETQRRMRESGAVSLSGSREMLRSKLRETDADALANALQIAVSLLGKRFEPLVEAKQRSFDLLQYVYVTAGIPVVTEEDILILAQMNTAGAPVILSPEDGSVMSINSYDRRVIYVRDGYVLESLPEAVA